MNGIRFRAHCTLASIVMLGVATRAGAGVINPDISVIGQPFLSLTDDHPPAIANDPDSTSAKPN